jgi:serine protease Do
VIGVDDRVVADNSELSRYIASRPPGATVRLKLVREGAEKTLSVTLGTFPDENEESEEAAAGEDRPQLGMTLRELSPELAERLDLPRGTRGLVVMDVEGGEAAEEAGLQRGDLIVSVNGEPVEDIETFRTAVDRARADGLARLRVRRGDSHLFLILKLK